MEKNHLSRKILIKRILLLSIIIGFLGAGIQTFSNKSMPFFSVSAQQDSWILSLKISESSGREATIVLKGSPNASDSQDDLDIPIPPPPMPPIFGLGS